MDSQPLTFPMLSMPNDVRPAVHPVKYASPEGEVSVSEFLDGGHLEVSIYSFIDNIKRNKPKKIVELARGRLGEKGYDLKDNNCEHFCNEVTFNKHYSSMSDEYFKK